MNENMLDEIKAKAKLCTCGHHQPITVQSILIEAGAIQQLGVGLKGKRFERVVIAADQNTYDAAGRLVEESLFQAGITSSTCLILPNENNDVVADEQAIIQLMLEASVEHTDAIVAVGSGTLHDIVRFVSHKMQKVFLSVPTAPSVDGFTSKGAPVIIRGQKITIPACAPMAIYADLNVLTHAPQPLIAAGFGDMLAKYTSLFDWKFGHLTAKEPFCQAAEQLTMHSLDECIQYIDEIAAGSEKGVRILITALIQSGLAMLLFGQSHSASGAEHHLSHYWEMEYLRKGKRQLLHGAKVAVACAEISRLYHDIVENKQISLEGQDFQQLEEYLQEVPKFEEIERMVRRVQGPATSEELGIEIELLNRSLAEAHTVRLNRHTLLRAFNQGGRIHEF